MSEPSIKTLSSIYNNFQTPINSGDKGTFHSYIEIYENLFQRYRNKPINFLEIGVMEGLSIKMWQEFFAVAKIYGVDIEQKNHLGLDDDRTFIIQCDATSEKFLEYIEDLKFSIIIDDGSHFLHDQIASFKLLKDRIEDGGIYIIEDLWPEHIDNIQNEFGGIFEVVDMRNLRPHTPDNILMIYKNK